MRRFLKSIILFIPLSVLAYLILLVLWGTFMPTLFQRNFTYPLGAGGHMHTRVREIKTVKNADILFVGSSHCYRGFDTRIFKQSGYTSFNLGSSSQTPLQTEILLKRYLFEVNPKLVVFEVSPMSFWADGVESSLDIIANDHIDWEITKLAAKQKSIRVINVFLYSIMDKTLGINKNFTEPISKNNDTYIEGGFVERALSFTDKSDRVENISPIKAEQLVAFENCLTFLKRNNVNFMLVQAPITKCNYERYNANSKFDSIMASKGKYYNYNNILSLNDTLHFYDSHHLNSLGVKEFNQHLVDSILVNEFR